MMVVTRRAAAGTGALFAVLLAGAAYGQSAAYVREMPSVADVQRQIKGGDKVDTLGHQAAVFELLKDVIRAQAGDADALTAAGKLTRPERDLAESYMAAQRAIFATPGIDQSDLTQNASRYHATPSFTDDTINLFFSAPGARISRASKPPTSRRSKRSFWRGRTRRRLACRKRALRTTAGSPSSA